MAVGTKDLAPEQLHAHGRRSPRRRVAQVEGGAVQPPVPSATGQLDNHGRLRRPRRTIARIYTEMRERELGIGSPPPLHAPTRPTSPPRRRTKRTRRLRRLRRRPRRPRKVGQEG